MNNYAISLYLRYLPALFTCYVPWAQFYHSEMLDIINICRHEMEESTDMTEVISHPELNVETSFLLINNEPKYVKTEFLHLFHHKYFHLHLRRHSKIIIYEMMILERG